MIINNVNSLFKGNCNNYNEMRDYSITSNFQDSRFLSTFSNISKEAYIVRIQHKSNKMVEDDQNILSDSSLLEYTTQKR